MPASQGRNIIASTSLTAAHVSSEPSSSGDQRPDAFRRHLSVVSLLKLDLLFPKKHVVRSQQLRKARGLKNFQRIHVAAWPEDEFRCRVHVTWRDTTNPTHHTIQSPRGGPGGATKISIERRTCFTKDTGGATPLHSAKVRTHATNR